MKAFCIKCGEPDAVITLDLDGTNEFQCRTCEENFTCEEVQTVIDAMKDWVPILKWIGTSPITKE